MGVLIRIALTRWVGPGIPTYITFSPFVLLAALIGGWGPGLLTTLATAAVVNYWLLPPAGSFKIASRSDAVGLAFFCVMGILVSLVAELYRRTRDHLGELVAVRPTALSRTNEQLHQEVAERRRAEDEKKKLVHDLRERIKELTAMYRTMEIVQQPKPVHELLQEVVSLLPRAWQYPEITAARISFDGQEYRTPGYAGSEWTQSARFSTCDARDGGIEVVYLEKRPAEAEGPFLAEERSLIDSLARILEGFLNRRISEEAQPESEERFRTAFEEGSVAMALTALDTTLLKVNSRFCRMLGFSESELVGRSFTEITHPDDRTANLVGTRQLARGEISSFHMEKRYLRKDGAVLWADMNTASVQDAKGRPLYCVTPVQDITERKRAEAALRANEQRFRALTERGTDVVAIFDPEGKITYISPSIQALFGSATEEIVGQSLFAFIHPEDAERTQTLIAEALRELNATLESKVARRTAELQHRAMQLQKLTLELAQAEERERRRIALILHEDLQQQVAGARFHPSLVRGRARGDRVRTDLDEVDAVLKEAVEKSRRLSHDLGPAVMQMNDLAEVMRWLVDRARAQQGLNVNLTVSGDMMLQSEALAVFLFRSAQEMLVNVVKHAQVREAAIRVRKLGRHVCLCVSDQGLGFDPQELKETPGVGLFSIRERTELLGGRMKIKSARGNGSSFSITVPDGPKVKDER